jgi:hypothetical protein
VESVGFGFLRVLDFDRWTVAELIGRFRAQSFTSASHSRDRISFPVNLNSIEAGGNVARELNVSDNDV